MKFLSLSFIAAAAVVVSASTVDVNRLNVATHDTVSNVLNGAVVADNAQSPRVSVLRKRKVAADAKLRRIARRHHHWDEDENEPDENERDENERDENERDENEHDENERDEHEYERDENEPDEEEEDENEVNESSVSKIMRRGEADEDEMTIDEEEEDEEEADEDELKRRYWGGEDEEEEDENEYEEDENEYEEDEYEADENEFKRRDVAGGLVGGLPVNGLLGTDRDGEGANSKGVLGGIGI